MIILSPSETTRFGVRVARTDPNATDVRAIDAAAQSADVEMLIARVSADNIGIAQALEDVGFRLMDTLVYADRALPGHWPDRQLSNDITIRNSVRGDAEKAEHVAQAAFANYVSHYHADPRLDNEAAAAGYGEWAGRMLLDSSDDRPTVVSEVSGVVAGFLAMRSVDESTIDIVLNAVHPKFQGKGIYSALLTAALNLASSSGHTRILSSTQANNYAVQRIWTSFGFSHFATQYTFHKWYR